MPLGDREGAVSYEAEPGDLPVVAPLYLRGIGDGVYLLTSGPSYVEVFLFFYGGSMNNENEIVLVLGGARSGKSAFAEKYVLHAGAKVSYIATAEVLDDEMANRVQYHRARRNNGRWFNYEAPYDAAATILEAAKKGEAILFDCLTVYLSNLIYGKDAPEEFNAKYDYAYKEIAKLLKAAREVDVPVVFVSNEVGAGIVPATPIGREYRDIAGWVNQQVAKEADKVYYVIAGQAVDVKKMAYKFEDTK